MFKVSTDYLLGISSDACIKTEGLSSEDIKLLYKITEHLRHKNTHKNTSPEFPSGVFDFTNHLCRYLTHTEFIFLALQNAKHNLLHEGQVPQSNRNQDYLLLRRLNK